MRTTLSTPLERHAQKRARRLRMNLAGHNDVTAMMRKAWLDGHAAGVREEKRAGGSKAPSPPAPHNHQARAGRRRRKTVSAK